MTEELSEVEEEEPLVARAEGFLADLLNELHTEEQSREDRLMVLKILLQGGLQVADLLGMPSVFYALDAEDGGFRNVLCGRTLRAAEDWNMVREDMTRRMHEAQIQAKD